MTVSRRGPQPGPAGGSHLGPARRRVLQVVAEQPAGHPITLAEVAQRLGGHPNTSRQHLDALLAEGLVDAEPLARPGPGRRPIGYSLSRSGRHSLTEPADDYRDLVDAFATYLVRRPDASDEAQQIGELWGRKQAASLPEDVGEAPLDRLVELLDMLGFAPARADDDGRAVVLTHCPLLDLAHDHREVVCELHRGMVDGVMRTLGAQTGVELLPYSDPHGCRLREPGAE